MARVLLLLPKRTYRSKDFLAAAERLKVDVVAASDETSALEHRHPGAFLTLRFHDLEASVRVVRDFHSKYPIDAVVGVDDETSVTAAAISTALSLRHNSVESALAASNKRMLAELLIRHGVPAPAYRIHSRTEDPLKLAVNADYPCVLKPIALSASRGVIRADNPSEFLTAWARIGAILDAQDIGDLGSSTADQILVQEYISGPEFALEGLLSGGFLRTLALFDKPDPLEGPFFEETIYVTPSRRSRDEQEAIAECVSQGAKALGLREGPVHAEIRLSSRGPILIELAARSIGGLCSRTLRFGTGLYLEDLILKHALGMSIEGSIPEGVAAGVMMVPIPRAGTLQEVKGLKEARKTPGIEEITITATLGKPIVPLPEGSSYLGFIFSRGPNPDEAVRSLRAAYRKLEVVIC